ncbi:MAG: redox-sensing transcriptional repressor Rex [Bacillota bacterium]|nr:redox-sensing transcriptional repressor Rex [Bacillota bacterium]
MRDASAPEVVVRRLALYLRVLNGTSADDKDYISSQELGERTSVSAAQVRKDLAFFGEFGKQGVGYEVRFLRGEIARILNVDRVVRFVILGAGELGVALARYTQRRRETEHRYPFLLAGLFDVDPSKIGQMVDGTAIEHLDALQDAVKEGGVRMALITVPAQAAQEAVNAAVRAGIRAILNFAPKSVSVPENVRLHNADVTLDLHHLAYFL